MSEPVSMIVPLPSPAGADVQALAACEFIIDAQAAVAARLSGQSSSEFKCRVVLWLAEKYLKQETQVGTSLSLREFMRVPCSRPGCNRESLFPCSDLNCPKRSS